MDRPGAFTYVGGALVFLATIVVTVSSTAAEPPSDDQEHRAGNAGRPVRGVSSGGVPRGVALGGARLPASSARSHKQAVGTFELLGTELPVYHEKPRR